MFKRSLITILLAIGAPALAEEASPLFLDELETLAQFEETDVLTQSVRDYYAKDPSLAKGKYPSLLHDAAIFGMSNLLQHLIANGPHHLDYAYVAGPTPLGYIAGDNQLEAAKVLLEAGASPNNSGNTKGIYPLSSAVISGNMKMIELLLKHGAIVHIGSYYQSPLGITLEKNDIEILQLFVATNFELNPHDPELRILLIEYLNSDLVEEEVLRILIRHGLDIYAKSEDQDSFIEEYGKLINYSDVKQMLEDIYLEFHPAKSVQLKSEETKDSKTTDTKIKTSEDPTSSAEEADKLKDELRSYISELDDSAASDDEGEEESTDLSTTSDKSKDSTSTKEEESLDDDEDTVVFSEIKTQNNEPPTANATGLNKTEDVSHNEVVTTKVETNTDFSTEIKTTIGEAKADESTNLLNSDRIDNSKSDKGATKLSEISTQTVENSTTSAADTGSSNPTIHSEPVDATVDLNSEINTITENTETSSETQSTLREIDTQGIDSDLAQSNNDVDSTINTQPE